MENRTRNSEIEISSVQADSIVETYMNQNVIGVRDELVGVFVTNKGLVDVSRIKGFQNDLRRMYSVEGTAQFGTGRETHHYLVPNTRELYELQVSSGTYFRIR